MTKLRLTRGTLYGGDSRTLVCVDFGWMCTHVCRRLGGFAEVFKLRCRYPATRFSICCRATSTMETATCGFIESELLGLLGCSKFRRFPRPAGNLPSPSNRAAKSAVIAASHIGELPEFVPRRGSFFRVFFSFNFTSWKSPSLLLRVYRCLLHVDGRSLRVFTTLDIKEFPYVYFF